MAHEVEVVPVFGGGLNLSGNPLYIDKSEWMWSNGFRPHRGTAEVMRGYAEFTASGWQPSNHFALGIVADPFLASNRVALLVTRDLSDRTDTGVVVLGPTGTATALSSTGTEPAPVSTQEGASGMAVVSGLGYIALGTEAETGAANTSTLLKYTPAASVASSTFTSVDAANCLVGLYCAASGGRVWLADAGRSIDTSGSPAATNPFVRARQVRYSDANDGTVWATAITNSADTVTLDSRTPLTGLAPITGGMVVTSHDALFVFRATGSIPAYTVETVIGQGSIGKPVSTPAGVVLSGSDGLTLMGGGRISDRLGLIASKLYDMQWHPEYQAVCISAVTGGATDDVYYLDPTTGQAWRVELPTGVQFLRVRNGSSCVARFITTSSPTGGEEQHWIHMVVDEGSSEPVFAESRTMTDAYSGAFVCSKLFAFGAPYQSWRLHRIKVDVEPLSNATTDSIKVSVCAMDHLSSGILGSTAMDMDGLSYTDVPNGTLTGGLSEVPCDFVGKYLGFKFTQVSGKTRIRGFSFEWSPAGDRIP